MQSSVCFQVNLDLFQVWVPDWCCKLHVGPYNGYIELEKGFLVRIDGAMGPRFSLLWCIATSSIYVFTKIGQM